MPEPEPEPPPEPAPEIAPKTASKPASELPKHKASKLKLCKKVLDKIITIKN